MVSDAKKGDLLWFHFSGHGSTIFPLFFSSLSLVISQHFSSVAQIDDKSGDEADGKDESIVPFDFQKAGVIIDDDVSLFFFIFLKVILFEQVFPPFF